MTGCGIVELRRYALHPGAREILIELFEREFIESQERVGNHVLGTFRDPDDPDSFVWLRGFADMHARVRALGSFYEGPVWAQHRDAANATMIDSNNVFLLRPLDDPSRLAMDGTRRALIHRSSEPSGAAAVTICPLDPGREGPFFGFFRSKVEPLLRASGADVRARFATERSTNNYPALPVREGENVFVWLSLFADQRARNEHVEAIDLRTLLGNQLAGDPDVWRLDPTSRSLLPDQ
jgi:quinol monooxygenase YgiN